MRRMKLIPLFLLVGMSAMSGWAEGYTPKTYSPELVKKAEAGDAVAQYDLGGNYFFGVGLPKGVTQDYKEAVKWYTKSAEQGNKMAQSFLGICYYLGNGVTQDYKEAVKWFTKSAEQGCAGGQSNLGDCYKDGKGVPKSLSEAVKWYTKSAEQGNESAKRKLEELKSK